MTSQRIVASIVALGLVVAAIAASPGGTPVVRGGACASPLAEGRWTGTFTFRQRLAIRRRRLTYDWTNTGTRRSTSRARAPSPGRST